MAKYDFLQLLFRSFSNLMSHKLFGGVHLTHKKQNWSSQSLHSCHCHVHVVLRRLSAGGLDSQRRQNDAPITLLQRGGGEADWSRKGARKTKEKRGMKARVRKAYKREREKREERR